MIVLLELILIGDFKTEGSGAVVEVVDRWYGCYWTLNCLSMNLNWYVTSLLVQVRDEYRTDYDPDILLNIGRSSYILTFLVSTFVVRLLVPWKLPWYQELNWFLHLLNCYLCAWFASFIVHYPLVRDCSDWFTLRLECARQVCFRL